MVRLRMRSFVKSVSFLAAFSLILNFTADYKVSGQKQEQNRENRLKTDFQNAAREFGVPEELLISIAYAETRFDNHEGAPSSSNGYGLMHLVSNPYVQTLEMAAKLTGAQVEDLKTN